MGSLYLGGPSMIATDMMTFIKDDLGCFWFGCCICICNHALSIFWKYLVCFFALN
jgi:hypothetical protein